MEDRLDVVTREIIEGIEYWSGPETIEWTERDYHNYADCPDEEIRTRILTSKMSFFMRHVNPPVEFWDRVAELLLSTVRIRIRRRQIRRFNTAIERLRGRELTHEMLDTGDAYEESAYYLLKYPPAEEKENLMRIFRLILAIVRQRSLGRGREYANSKEALTALANLEFNMICLLEKQHLVLFLPEELANNLLERRKNEHEIMIRQTRSKTFIVHNPEDVDDEIVDRIVTERVLRPELESIRSASIEDAILPEPKDPRFM